MSSRIPTWATSLQATAVINITVLKSGLNPSSTSSTPTGGAGTLALSSPSHSAGTTDNNTKPVDSDVQLQGFAAALAVLGG